jgi:transcriptional regulator with XRE-family HTH domain
MNMGDRIRALRALRGYTLEQLSERSGVDVGTISALENRRSTRSMYAPQIAAGLDVTLDVLMSSADDTPSWGHSLTGVEERASRYQGAFEPRLVSPHFVSWEAVVNGAEVGDLFAMAMPDDAAAPEFPKGAEVIWSKRKAPQVGSLVLVRDRHGQLHQRWYHQGSSPDHWRAAATHRAFATLDSIDDALQLVAVAAYKPMP